MEFQENKIILLELYLLLNMDNKALNISSPVEFDNSIAHYEIHAHQPYGSLSFNNSDEIRINVQNQDLFLLPCKSSLHISGKLTKDGNAAVESTRLINNGICHLFEEIRYEINGVEIDKIKNVGITSCLKNFLSLNPYSNYENAGWLDDDDDAKILSNEQGYFDVCIPLKNILGFAEDFQKVIVNAKHELILVRSRSDINAIIQTAVKDFNISLQKIEWLVPYITLSDKKKMEMIKFIQRDPIISMSFRSWELYEYPNLPTTNRHIWTIKTATQLEKPRYVILAFQNDRKNRTAKDCSLFDHCNITDVKLFLNSQSYPYGNLNLDIAKNQFSTLYEMYRNFGESFYGDHPEPLLNKLNFLNKAPLIVIDCSRQNEALKYGPVDVRLEFEAKNNFPALTSAYCLIIHDRIVEYRPISGTIQKLT